MTLKNKPTRIDPDFAQMLKNIKIQRIKNEIDITERGARELTKMMMNCPSFPMVKKELEGIPSKKDMQKFRRLDLI